MTEIRYRLIGDAGEWESFRDSHTETVEFLFDSDIDGQLLLADRMARVKCGSARLNIAQIPDGEYLPRLLIGERSLTLEGVRICGSSCTPLPTADRCIRRLLGRIYELEKMQKENEKKFTELTLMIQGNGLFE